MHSIGVMSINQAAIHFNLPYSSLYGRFKRGKFDVGLDGSGGQHQLEQSLDNSVSGGVPTLCWTAPTVSVYSCQ